MMDDKGKCNSIERGGKATVVIYTAYSTSFSGTSITISNLYLK